MLQYKNRDRISVTNNMEIQYLMEIRSWTIFIKAPISNIEIIQLTSTLTVDWRGPGV